MEFGGAVIGGEQINGIVGVDFDSACGPDIVYTTRFERREFNLPLHYVCLLSNDDDEVFYLDTSVVSVNGECPVLRVLTGDTADPELYAESFGGFLLKRMQFFTKSVDLS